MRIYSQQRHRMNSVVHMNQTSGFPCNFAICRSIRPVQFQLLTIIPDIHHMYEQCYFKIENDPVDITEPMFLDLLPQYEGGTSSNDFYMSTPGNPNHNSIRIRYEIQPMFLRNSHTVIPIVLLDSLIGLPRPEVLILPYNAESQAERPNEDPYMMMNFLRNQNNFAQPRRHDQERARLTFHSVYDDQSNSYIDRPIMYPRDYDSYYYTNDRRDQMRTPPMRALNAAGAGAGPAPIRVVEVPIPQEPREVQRPRALQAFTIQALISHAIKEQMTCPISMNPIDQQTACVTSCQHIFDRASIRRWLQRNTSCPVCREESITCAEVP